MGSPPGTIYCTRPFKGAIHGGIIYRGGSGYYTQRSYAWSARQGTMHVGVGTNPRGRPTHKKFTYSRHAIDCLVQWAVQYLPVGYGGSCRLCTLSLRWKEGILTAGQASKTNFKSSCPSRWSQALWPELLSIG